MSKERKISFRLEKDKIDALDVIADKFNRDRSSILNEAVGNYLELEVYYTALIKKGLAAVKQGRIIGANEVRAGISTLARSRRGG